MRVEPGKPSPELYLKLGYHEWRVVAAYVLPNDDINPRKFALFTDAMLCGDLLWDADRIRYEPMPCTYLEDGSTGHYGPPSQAMLRALHILIAETWHVQVEVKV